METYEEISKTSLGYPCNLAYDYTKVFPTLKYRVNNVGDPWCSSTYKCNSKDIERQVLKFFADLWGIQDYWGYITSGSTESNIEGLYVAREVYPDAIFYTSQDSHYSLFKIAKLLKLNLCVIDTEENGEMDYVDFERKLIINKDRPLIVNINLGTTMKSAFDDPKEIYRIIKKHNCHHKYYAHADGALMGFTIPFLQKDLLFRSHIHSISISGHKWCGIPFPCGIFLMERHLRKLLTNEIEYIGSDDNTISGSRNGHAAIFFKHIIDTKTLDEMQNDVNVCIENAEYLVECLNKIDVNANAWRNQNSITVVFKKPCKEIIDKWQIACQGDLGHIVVMPHATREKLDEFLSDYIKN
jgi:histidine decarboxylase